MNIKKIALYLLLGAQLSVFQTKANNGYFTKTNVEAGISSAAAANKLLIVHFMADWCMPSQWMDRNTFQEAPVNQMLHENYLGIKVDVDAAEGHQDMETYQVSTLPTLLIFSASGNELARLEGITDATKLMAELQQFNQSRFKTSLQANKRPSKSPLSFSGIDFSHLDRPALVPNTVQEIKEVSVPSRSTSNSKREQKANYYGIEVAVLHQYSAVIRYVSNLENRLSEKVYIQFDKIQNRKNYKVIVGKFDNRKEAFRTLAFLQQQQIRGKMTQFE